MIGVGFHLASQPRPGCEFCDGPYLEMFARQRRPGWDAWGIEPDRFEAVA